METYKTHPYYTHQPFFIEILKNTTGNILEWYKQGHYPSEPNFIPNPNGKVLLNIIF